MSSSSKMKGKRPLPLKICRGKLEKIKYVRGAKNQAGFVVESAEGCLINYRWMPDSVFCVLCVTTLGS